MENDFIAQGIFIITNFSTVSCIFIVTDFAHAWFEKQYQGL
jgi:hypothetical protein